jgi:hypothetical protein
VNLRASVVETLWFPRFGKRGYCVHLWLKTLGFSRFGKRGYVFLKKKESGDESPHSKVSYARDGMCC